MWGHSHTLSSLPVQFRSSMNIGFISSVYLSVSGMAPAENDSKWNSINGATIAWDCQDMIKSS